MPLVRSYCDPAVNESDSGHIKRSIIHNFIESQHQQAKVEIKVYIYEEWRKFVTSVCRHRYGTLNWDGNQFPVKPISHSVFSDRDEEIVCTCSKRWVIFDKIQVWVK